VGFEPTTPMFKREKTIHALDCGATVIGTSLNNPNEKKAYLFLNDIDLKRI
jgi:hypothetical protein